MAYLFIVVLVDGFQGAPVNSEGRKAGIVAAGRQVVDTDVDAQAAPLVLLFVILGMKPLIIQLLN